MALCPLQFDPAASLGRMYDVTHRQSRESEIHQLCREMGFLFTGPLEMQIGPHSPGATESHKMILYICPSTIVPLQGIPQYLFKASHILDRQWRDFFCLVGIKRRN